LEREGRSKFIIATHSTILLAYPTAEIFSLDGGIRRVAYRETEHYQLTKSFLDDPDLYFRYLFAGD
jgi:predicted ATPase